MTQISLVKKILAVVFLTGSFLGIYTSSLVAKTSDQPYNAPEIVGIESWINSQPLKIAALKGQVVLVDFWTYSCINCIRTLPHIKDWHEKYHDKGLVIIGVHAPEFEFEKSLLNVKKAVEKFEIKYPVALDSNLKTWNNYSNHYWPAHYLINKEGKVVEVHFGEGNYENTENKIRELLGLEKLGAEKFVVKNSSESQFKKQSPETYLGSDRARNNVNEDLKNLNFPSAMALDKWSLSGKWKIAREYIESGRKGDAIRFNFEAKKVFLVMENVSKKPIKAEIFVNEKLVKNVEITSSQLYELADLKDSTQAIIEIKFNNSGARAYAFTFGN